LDGDVAQVGKTNGIGSESIRDCTWQGINMSPGCM
jgi:hypothetical protein